MTRSKLMGVSALLALAIATPSVAEQRGQGRGRPAGQASAGRAVPRGPVQGAPPVARPGPGAPGARGRVYGAPARPYGYPGRPYGYAYRPHYGYPYRPYGYYPRYYYGYPYYGYPGASFYFGFGYPFGFSASFGYPYPAYTYPPSYAYPPYGYAYPPAGYSSPAPAGSSGVVTVGQSTGSGSIRLDVDQRDAEVYVDGNYAGVVDDFSGSRRLELTSERHRIEIRREGFDPVAFDVNVEPGRTVTYRSRLRPVTP